MKKQKTKICKKCKEPINKKAKRCPHCGAKQGTPKWLIILILILIIGGIGGMSGGKDDGEKFDKNKDKEVVVVDFSAMDKEESINWCSKNKVNCIVEKEYSDSVDNKKLISQSVETDDTIYEGEKITLVYSMGKEPSKEFKNALKKAESYSENMHMSKQAIYDQLTSEYGEQFPEDAAQYAMDNLEADWNANALASAESYSKNLHMSKQGIYEQLISDYADKFTKKQAQYAIDNIDADWNANALEKAKSYYESMDMSKDAVYDQLVSEYGEQFTEEQAQYAIDHLEDEE